MKKASAKYFNEELTLTTREELSEHELCKKWNNLQDLTKDLGKFISKKSKNLNRLNIIIMGKTGVGKSTLINNTFRGDMAKTGIGKAMTQDIDKITKPNFPLTIYDTPGLELDAKKQNTLREDVFDLIEKQAKKNDFNEAIHCIWYCINCESKRIEEAEDRFIKQFTNDSRLGTIPVILILTQCYDDKVRDQMINKIKKKKMSIRQIVPVVAKERKMSICGNSITIPSYGLDTLIEVMENCLPEILHHTLQNVQIASIKRKRKCAIAAIATAVAAASAVGASPIPFSDCLILAPIEFMMLTSITSIYGVDVSSGFIADFVSSTIGGGTASILGRFAVTNILKLIPGVGSVIGGVVSAATAGILTSALGATYIPIIEQIFKHEFNWQSLPKDEFKHRVKDMYKNKIKEEKKKK